ncbi:alpha/beta fold hydrolase [Pseudidiomarina taiwanensis]|uniref:Alpha/beta hydrolase n=1 Tax=Pseudidiomarina taiwanensis TaxID=337250 RepID=A0A432ZNW3_9GAMM|nr:alpha/beta hydrolase [Pseudidiomarina taiwanensis]RUO79589.1 alpha/beta hydrolase [Pseudidiomarina taiwanensis]
MRDLSLPGVYFAGDAAKPPVLLLHSSQSSAGQWRALVAELAKSYAVLSVDLLGYGAAPAVTGTPESFRFEAEIPRILEALEKAQVRQPVTLIGHSYGGALALKLALEQPFAVARLVMFEPVAFHLLEATEAARQEIDQVAENMASLSQAEATAGFVDYWNFHGFFAALPSKMQGLMIAQGDKVNYDFSALMGEPYGLDDYRNIKVPSLLLRGEHTRQSAHAVADKLLSALPEVTAKTLPTGHMGPITHAAQVNQAILNFLTSTAA